MPYAPYYPGGWQNYPSTATPVVAAALQNIENGLTTATTAILITPSGDATGATDAAAINTARAALPAHGGKITLVPSADWYIKCGQVSINGSGIYLDITGCFIHAVGAGDMIRLYDSSNLQAGRAVWGGGIVGMGIVDGTSTTGNACALHAGDITQLAVFMQAQNFTAGTTSKGVWLDNNYYWTEQCYGRIVAQNCRTHVQFDNSANLSGSAGGSFFRLDMGIYINSNGAGDGVWWTNGAASIDFRLGIYGNFLYSASAVYAALKLSGGTATASLESGQLDMGLEVDGSGVHQPVSITFETSPVFTFINNCHGIIDVTGFAASNNVGGNFQYAGSSNDTALTPVQNLPTPANAGTISGNGSTILIQWYGIILLTVSGGSYTGTIMQAGGYAGQVITIINTSGSNTVTFAASGTSRVADGTSDVIGVLTAATYYWSGSLWYRTV